VNFISNQLRFPAHRFFEHGKGVFKFLQRHFAHQGKLDPVAVQQVITFIADDDSFFPQLVADVF